MQKIVLFVLMLICIACNPTLDKNTCEIYISNTLVVIYEKPQHFSQEIVKVPAGKYQVLDKTTTKWVNQDERWLKISVGKREGWIEDNTWTIREKSDACP